MKTPLQCLVTRLRLDDAATSPNLIARPRLALYLTDPDKPIETSEQLLQRLFGLTAAEARVLERLTAGLSVEEIAQGSGVSPATVRVQLKALFKKTNTRRQADLIQQVTTSPLWIARNHQAVGGSNAGEGRRLGV
ncbi:MAG: helix-turn-helix transcriptional regulator [Zoogloea sp.]|nr:helix-turn-helix transcriptional regulator [Zoogloea sp.]MCA0187611.1 helix-turn-helix transcriptional regulator [Pseudomonadota bacterium]